MIVSIATGRMYSGTRDIARSIRVRGPVGCIDGSHIVQAENDGHLHTHPIAAGAAAHLLATLERTGVSCFILSDDTIHHDAGGARYLSYVRIWSRCTRQVARLCLEPPDAIGPVTAVIGIGERDRVAQAEAALNAPDGSVQVAVFPIGHPALRGQYGMVVRASGIDKASAVAWIARHHGCSLEQTVVVGDWHNDIPMMKTAGRSFAMAQAPEEVSAVATDRLRADVTTGGGIAEAAERAGLL